MSEFYLGAHEVTVGQFREFVKATGHKTEAEKEGSLKWTGQRYEQDANVNWRNPGFKQEDNEPVTCVSWNDAKAYCKWLNGLPDEKRPNGWVYRLPREAEWEYAARGGAAKYQAFQFGDKFSSDLANFNGNHPYGGADKGEDKKRTTPVGSYRKPNDFGLHDMHGNVWEWCTDWYGDYDNDQRKDPAGPLKGSFRVTRGGAWDFWGTACRSASRGRLRPIYGATDVGFRVALVPASRSATPD